MADREEQVANYNAPDQHDQTVVDTSSQSEAESQFSTISNDSATGLEEVFMDLDFDIDQLNSDLQLVLNTTTKFTQIFEQWLEKNQDAKYVFSLQEKREVCKDISLDIKNGTSLTI